MSIQLSSKNLIKEKRESEELIADIKKRIALKKEEISEEEKTEIKKVKDKYKALKTKNLKRSETELTAALNNLEKVVSSIEVSVGKLSILKAKGNATQEQELTLNSLLSSL